MNIIFRILKAKSYFHLSDFDKAAALLERIPVIDTPLVHLLGWPSSFCRPAEAAR